MISSLQSLNYFFVNFCPSKPSTFVGEQSYLVCEAGEFSCPGVQLFHHPYGLEAYCLWLWSFEFIDLVHLHSIWLYPHCTLEFAINAKTSEPELLAYLEFLGTECNSLRFAAQEYASQNIFKFLQGFSPGEAVIHTIENSFQVIDGLVCNHVEEVPRVDEAQWHSRDSETTLGNNVSGDVSAVLMKWDLVVALEKVHPVPLERYNTRGLDFNSQLSEKV